MRDIASVVARVLTGSGQEGKTYDIIRPQALTRAEMADQLSKAGGKPIKYVDVPPHAMRQALLGFGMPAWQANGIVEDYDRYRRGEAGVVTQTVSDVTGSEATSFTKFTKDDVGRLPGKAAGAS